jgi:hypothetical protein
LPTIQDISHESKRLLDELNENNFTKDQRTDIGLITGGQSILGTLSKLTNNAGLEIEQTRESLKGGGKFQARLGNAFNMYRANAMHDQMLNDSGMQDPKLIPQLRSFAASRNPVANRFINRLHLNDEKRLLTKSQTRMVLWDCLGVDLQMAKYTCLHCNTPQCTYAEHAETCRSSRTKIYSDGKVTHPTRSAALHKEAKRLLTEHFRMIADVHVGNY